MSGDTLKRVKSVKRWLEKAENSYSNHKELTGEMNLIMAQAEMQRLKEVRGTSPRRKWLLRGGALAVAGALFLGASFLKDSFLHLRLLQQGRWKQQSRHQMRRLCQSRKRIRKPKRSLRYLQRLSRQNRRKRIRQSQIQKQCRLLKQRPSS